MQASASRSRGGRCSTAAPGETEAVWRRTARLSSCSNTASLERRAAANSHSRSFSLTRRSQPADRVRAWVPAGEGGTEGERDELSTARASTAGRESNTHPQPRAAPAAPGSGPGCGPPACKDGWVRDCPDSDTPPSRAAAPHLLHQLRACVHPLLQRLRVVLGRARPLGVHPVLFSRVPGTELGSRDQGAQGHAAGG